MDARSDKIGRPGTLRARRAALALAFALGASATTGCGREFFREWADMDVSEAVFEKSRDPRWRLETFSIEPPAMSRHGNPYDPDRIPAPPDDRATEALGPVPQWPVNRLLTPTEGTGYIEMLESWQTNKRQDPVRPVRDLRHPVRTGRDDSSTRLRLSILALPPRPEFRDHRLADVADFCTGCRPVAVDDAAPDASQPGQSRPGAPGLPPASP